ncbi:hypothetical protein [Gordoniibacillus kamchatkensis]|uniref:hypothetical protein n=1 Tax=Gordoniibacillus kamchatkensis TaxID=1590651 RepID=UPI0012E071A8|nr:hypothetical protein [Paenibacillus sp. VKM B-2647]
MPNQPEYLRALRARRNIGHFIGFCIVITIVGGFMEYGFLKGLLFLLGGLIIWWIINIILNLVFGLIVHDLINSESKKMLKK